MTDGSAEEATAVADAAAQPAPEAAAAVGVDAEKREMKPSTRLALIVIGVVAAVMVLGMVWVYVIEGRKYVSTDNAQVDGDKITVNAPSSGTLTDWTATQGTQLIKDRVLGRIKIQAGFAQPQQPIKAPGDGTIVVDDGVEGAFVAAGTQLAVAYDLAKIYVTARVDETDVDDVHPGQTVDIDVDAFPGVDLVGTVTEVQGGAAGEFSAFPQSNTAGNFQKVTQVIPVKIAIDDTKNLSLVPGMNVTVKIHKDS
jgi:multidrug resistance efflux pump